MKLKPRSSGGIMCRPKYQISSRDGTVMTAKLIHQVVGRLPVRSWTCCAQAPIMRRMIQPPTSATTKAMVAQLKVIRAPRSRLPGSLVIPSVGMAV